MKKMINNPDNIVDEMLNGMVAAHPDYVKRVDGCDVLGPCKRITAKLY